MPKPIWVRSGGVKRLLRKADGTRAAPFRTIRAAIKQARIRGLGAVEIKLEPGDYHERVDLIMDTTLAGVEFGPVWLEGPIVNYGHSLRIRNLKIGNQGPCAVLSVGASSQTDLRCVAIDGTGERGVQQSGGHLMADWLAVRGTRARTRADTGVGVLLGNGAKAELRNVELSGNGAPALVARHRGTVAVAENLYVANTKWHPAMENAEDLRVAGAVHVGEGATLFGTSVRLENNDMCGVLIRGLFSGAHLDGAVVDSTREVAELEPRGGGIAALVDDTGALELRRFVLEEADLCGLSIGVDCWVSAANGTIRRNPIGAALWDSDFPLRLIATGVTYVDNDLNLDVDVSSLPVPEFPNPLDDRSDDDSAIDLSGFPGRTQVRWEVPYRFPLRLLDERRLRDLFSAGFS